MRRASVLALTGPTSLIVNDSTISNNRMLGLILGGFGHTTAVVKNSTISGNGFVTGRGGIQVGSHGRTDLELIHVTVNENVTAGGASLAMGSFGATNVNVTNSIIAGTIGGSDCTGGTLVASGFNLDSDGSCGFGKAGDLPATDPMLGPLTGNGGPTLTHAPRTGSPIVDAADITACTSTDQRNAPRPTGVGCDLGALEAGAIPPDPSEPEIDPVEATIPIVRRHVRWTENNRCYRPPTPPPPSPTKPPTAIPTAVPTPGIAFCVCDTARREVPPAVIAAALANPNSVYGWRHPLDPGKPISPANPLRECLNIRNPSLHYEPVGNPIIWRVGCR